MTDLFVVDGPPGCGKTEYLKRQAELAANKYGPDNVAIASLTRTAASEIRGRTDIHAENVSTLHAHAYRALDRPDLAETGDGIKEWNLEHPAAELSSGPRRIEDGPLGLHPGQPTAATRGQGPGLPAVRQRTRSTCSPDRPADARRWPRARARRHPVVRATPSWIRRRHPVGAGGVGAVPPRRLGVCGAAVRAYLHAGARNEPAVAGAGGPGSVTHLESAARAMERALPRSTRGTVSRTSPSTHREDQP